jgi:hydrogenase nickel incorporation protein HypA/HybF
MHELSITQAILDTALRYAQQAGAQKISALNLRIGALSGVVADSVQFYFDFVNKGTLAEGAELHIEIAPPRVRCRACGVEQELSPDLNPAGEWYTQIQSLPPCDCGRHAYELCGGFDCFLDSIEV